MDRHKINESQRSYLGAPRFNTLGTRDKYVSSSGDTMMTVHIMEGMDLEVHRNRASSQYV